MVCLNSAKRLSQAQNDSVAPYHGRYSVFVDTFVRHSLVVMVVAAAGKGATGWRWLLLVILISQYNTTQQQRQSQFYSTIIWSCLVAGWLAGHMIRDGVFCCVDLPNNLLILLDNNFFLCFTRALSLCSLSLSHTGSGNCLRNSSWVGQEYK